MKTHILDSILSGIFTEKDYLQRRKRLCEIMRDKGQSGAIVISGRNETPYSSMSLYSDYFHQDSSFLYYFGIKLPGLIGVINIETEIATLVGRDQTSEDKIWNGSLPTLAEIGEHVGVKNISRKIQKEKAIHVLPGLDGVQQVDLHPYLGEVHSFSNFLIDAVVEMRSIKDEKEIKHLDGIQQVAFKMFNFAKNKIHSGNSSEFDIANGILCIARNAGGNTSFKPIVSGDGDILHNPYYRKSKFERGKIILVDAGFESHEVYATDHTRVYAVGGEMSEPQTQIYNIVLHAKECVEAQARSGVSYLEMHNMAARKIVEGLIDVGLMKGSIEDAVNSGAHALFFPHGLGHMMGMDVHDMELLGEDRVGYNSTVKRSDQFGLKWLRMARKLETGMVVTVEPGIYFIPELIDEWSAKKMHSDYINYTELKRYQGFGGIRLEDSILITNHGCRLIGGEQIPI
jgi:Xaa-Pro dipeptidase